MTRRFTEGEESEKEHLITTARRKQFIEDGDPRSGHPGAPGRFINADGEEFDTLPGLVARNAPWAHIAVEVAGGYLAFESCVDYKIWHNRNERR